MRSTSLSTGRRASAGLLAGLAAIGCALIGCSSPAVAPAAVATPAPVPAAVTAPVPAPPLAPVPTPPLSAIASAVEGAYRLPAATAVEALPRTATTYVFIAADGSMKVGATGRFADARPVSTLAGVGGTADPCGGAPVSGVGAAADPGAFGGGRGVLGASRLGHGREFVSLGRGARGGASSRYELRADRVAVGTPTTVLVSDQQVPLELIVRAIGDLEGPVALAVDGGAAGASVMRLTVAPAPSSAGRADASSIGLTGDEPFVALVRRLDVVASGPLPIGVVIEVPVKDRRAVAAAGAAEIEGDIDKAIIRRYIKRNLPKLTYCYEKELLNRPRLEGKITAVFVIGPKGKVLSSKAEGFDPVVATCVAGVISTIEFPKPPPGGGQVTIRYPFLFRSGA